MKSITKSIPMIVTLLACFFLLVPIIQSVLAGLTVNYFRGLSSGLTLSWIGKVWALYSGSIFLSIWLALACLALAYLALVTLLDRAGPLQPPPPEALAGAVNVAPAVTVPPPAPGPAPGSA